MKIGIMGGSFDPIHLGHTEMAQHVLDEFGLDKIMFLPLGDPPHKKNITPSALRIQLIKCAIDGVDRFFLSTVEAERSGTTYTFDTVTYLQAQSDDEYFYIIGGDTVNTLHRWHRAKELFEKIKFIVVDREHVEESEGIKNVTAMGAKLLISKHTGLDISSTEVRQRVKTGQSIKGLVDKRVEEKILEYGLYKASTD